MPGDDFRPLRDQLLRVCAGRSADESLCALACALGEVAGGTGDPDRALDLMTVLARAVIDMREERAGEAKMWELN